MTPAQQPLFHENDSTQTPGQQAGTAATADGAAPVWLQRISLVVLVLFCMVLGVLITIMPWSTALWDYNSFFFSHPDLSRALHLGWVRGLISGVGVIDIWIGVSEALHYRDHRG